MLKCFFFVLILAMGPCAPRVQAGDDAPGNGDEKIVEKVKKRKNYCSPLEKAQGRCGTGEVNKNDAQVVEKIKKRKGYCSPLDKALKKC